MSRLASRLARQLGWWAFSMMAAVHVSRSAWARVGVRVRVGIRARVRVRVRVWGRMRVRVRVRVRVRTEAERGTSDSARSRPSSNGLPPSPPSLPPPCTEARDSALVCTRAKTNSWPLSGPG